MSSRWRAMDPSLGAIEARDLSAEVSG
jgi:hypothetical protein